MSSSDEEETGLTLFHKACMYGWWDVAERILELGLNPNCPEHIEWGIDPPLNLALQHGHTEMLDLLLRHGANPIVANKRGTSALHVVCRLTRSAYYTAAVFFQSCCRRQVWLMLDAPDKQGWTPLQLALTVSRDCDLIEFMLDKGANPLLPNPEGLTSLQYIVRTYMDNHESAPFQLLNRMQELARTMLIRGADPNLANDQRQTSLHLVARENHQFPMDFWYDVLLRINREAIRIDPAWIDVRDWLGFTPLHLVCLSLGARMTDYQVGVAEWLLRQGANPNSVSSGFGTTPVHCIARHEDNLSFMVRLLDICEGRHLIVRLDVQDRWGDTPLHLAARGGHRAMTQLLLEEFADPTVQNAKGSTPLHEVCGTNEDPFLLDFLETCRRIERSVVAAVNVRGSDGDTPLHLVLRRFHVESRAEVQALLSLGANPNLANNKGFTPLHEACRVDAYSRLIEFLEICRQLGRSVEAAVNTRDVNGETPLHLVLRTFLVDCRSEVQALLDLGANPTLADQDGMTPLHLICLKKDMVDGDLINIFFGITDRGQRILPIVDDVDNKDRTPLQLAVMSLSPTTVDALLDRGANIASFVFPTLAQFDELLRPSENRSNELKLRMVISASTLLERLERRGYELVRSDAMTIMRIIDTLGLFGMEVNPVTDLLENEEFTAQARTIRVKDDNLDTTSLLNLLRLPLKEAAKRFTCLDYFELVRHENKVRRLADGPRLICLAHLYKIMWTGFFVSWALEPFMILIHNLLPILCGEMIIENLNHEDLFNICLAVEDPNAGEENQNN
ncbi:hypothetical protein TKK_0004718 [Trichogramma kaykai]|uniref:Uncharacterized protein n=1 Tax=Trichogramma kaykai TaxID=54128 RepID=A0ABD2XJD7_9HYME